MKIRYSKYDARGRFGTTGAREFAAIERALRERWPDAEVVAEDDLFPVVQIDLTDAESDDPENLTAEEVARDLINSVEVD